MSAGGADILFEVRGPVAVATLNRPAALNALTLDMIRAFAPRLAAWTQDPAVRAVVVKGAGERAFCAGGDVRAVWRAGRRGDPLTADFFREEYALIRQVKMCAKPYIALIDGFVMGGGVGLSVHGGYRIASERTVFAMPETAIGLFPDVGGSYFLPHLPGELGMYLGLTGARLKAADTLYTGAATHYVESGRMRALEDALVGADWAGAEPHAVAGGVVARFAGDPGRPPLAAFRGAIDRCFGAESVEAVVARLEAEGGDWAATNRDILATRSPTSLKVTFAQLRRGAGLDFDAAMAMEYRLSQACMAGHDFYEGIRAVMIDKDNMPAWDPASLEAVSGESVEAHFLPLGDAELTFEGGR